MTVACGIWETYQGNAFQVYLPWDYYIPGSPEKNGTVEEGATVTALLVLMLFYCIIIT
jgi:hypothetical protein